MPRTREPLCFLAQLAGGATCLGTDRDGEATLRLHLSRHDGAAIMARLDELEEGFYVTLVPERDVTKRTRQSAEKRRDDG